jgi:hypothetical protein
MTLSSIISSNPDITSNLSWNLLVTSFPINIALQIRSWVHLLTCVPIHRATQIRSLRNPAISVPIHILSEIGRESFLSHYSNAHSTSN